MNSILVIGDLMLDRYVEGSVNRISPEAPVPVLKYETETMNLGGAGNLVANLVGLGHTPYILSAVGDDAIGSSICGMLSGMGVHLDFVKTLFNKETTNKTRFCSSGQHILRVDREEVASVDFFEDVKGLRYFDYILVSDYAKGVVTSNLLSQLQDKYYGSSTIILDPNVNNVDIYNELTDPLFYCITPNLYEAESMTNRVTYNIEDIAYNLTRFSNRVMITLGKDGVYAVERNYTRCNKAVLNRKSIKGDDVSFIDVSGAGDTVVAALTDGLIKGMNFFEAVEYSQKLARVVIGKKGTYAIRKEDL